tara:strand:- start:566 stop:691 length:126 start_codon:yes stop_codon:yes gene_type:complete
VDYAWHSSRPAKNRKQIVSQEISSFDFFNFNIKNINQQEKS